MTNQHEENVLITGGTGFLAAHLIPRLYNDYNVRVVARNEGKLIQLKHDYPNIEILTGDIADACIADKACADIDICYHLAAFKHVGLAEKQPYQCVSSNIIGTINILNHFYGTKMIAISTDKAAKVNGVYGATKMIMERLIKEYQQINKETKYVVVRYGNVLFSTGSVLTKWEKALNEGKEIIVTDMDATRFFFSANQAVELIFEAEKIAETADPYFIEMKSIIIRDLLTAMQVIHGTAVSIKEIGLQPGENMHEKIFEEGKTSEDADKYSIEEIIELLKDGQ